MRLKSREEIADSLSFVVKGITVVIIVGSIAAIIIDKCNIKLNKTEPTTTTIETNDEEIKEGDMKIYNPEEHYIKVEIPKTNEGPGELVDYSIPEGYDVYSINPYTKTEDDKIIEEGFTICYVNKEPVVVYATYDENIQAYEFNTFGYIVETQKTKQYNN